MQPEHSLIVGQWVNNRFIPMKKQPEKPITKVPDMVDWVLATYGDRIGSYAFIRYLPGELVIGEQLEFSLTSKKVVDRCSISG